MIGKLTQSLRGLSLILTVGIVVVSVSFTVIMLSQINQHYYSEEQQEIHLKQQALELHANTLSDLLDQVRFSVEALALSHDLQDIVEFGDTQDQQEWALRVRQYIPFSLGLGLVNAYGEISGDRQQLRIGDACIRDMHRILGNEPMQKPIIHRDIPGLEHFDIVTQVTTQSGEPAGLIFSSYRLDLLETWLDRFAEQNSMEIYLLDHTQEVLIKSDNINLQGNVKELQTQVPGNNLYLRIRFSPNAVNPVYNRVIVLNIVSIFVVVILLVVVAKRALSLYRKDLHKISDILIDVENDKPFDDSATPNHLAETKLIMEHIHQLAGRLSHRQNSLAHDSRHDALTGLPNRRYLEKKLATTCAMVKRGAGFSLAIIDIDHFKQVNDRFGHHTGDEILRLFSAAVKVTLRDTDFCARYAGDEFVLILFEMASTQKSIAAIRRIQQAFFKAQKEADLTDDLIATLSIGVYRMMPLEVHTPEHILEFADEALYEAKQQGRNRIIDFKDWKDLETTVRR